MNGSYPGASPRSEQGFWDHRHVDDNSVSLANSLSFQKIRHLTSLFVGLAKSPFGSLVHHVRDPYDGSFVGMGGQEAVEHVVGDIDLAIWIPSGERRVVGVEDCFGEGHPLDLLGLLFPELLAFLGRSCSSVLQFVGVLRHQNQVHKGGAGRNLNYPVTNHKNF